MSQLGTEILFSQIKDLGWDPKDPSTGPLLLTPPLVADDVTDLYLGQDYCIIDTAEQKIYTVDTTETPLDEIVFYGVPKLGRASMPLLFILACLYKPQSMPNEAMRDVTDDDTGEVSYSGPEAYLPYPVEGTVINPKDLIWTLPNDKVSLADGSTYYYVPMVADAVVSANGKIFTTSKGQFYKGQNRDTYLVQSSVNEDEYVEMEHDYLVKLAYGYYDVYTYADVPVTPVDDSTSPTENFLATYTTVEGYTTTTED